MPKAKGFAEQPQPFDGPPPSVEVTLGADGRLMIPAAIRDAAGIKRGQKVTLRVEDGRIVVETFWSRILAARAILARHVPPGVSLVDEFLAERRDEWGEEP